MTLLDINDCLDRQLPGATVCLQVLPDCHGLSLYLLNPGYDDRHLSQAQQNALSDDPPYWIFCWASGRALAQQILCGEVDVRGKTVVDFGAGSGVVAIAAALAGAATVVACEIDPVAHGLIRLNAAANGVNIDICTTLAALPGPVDWLLAADVLYERANLRWLDDFRRYAGAVLVADSRQKDLRYPGYTKCGTRTTTSFPDFAEAKAFNEVNFYRWEHKPLGF